MNKLIIISLLAILSFAVSCDSMDEIQREFSEKEEQVYLGKVDSLGFIPGVGRAQIIWYIGSDPKIEQTVIYWNMRSDSIVRDFNRTISGAQKESIIIEDLPEGSTLFEFRNKNSKGETSLFSSLAVTVWGENYADQLYSRKILSSELDHENSKYILGLSSTSLTDNVVYSRVTYTTLQGEEKSLRIERETNTVELPEFSAGTDLHFHSVFFLPLGLDSIYSNRQTYVTPTIVLHEGVKISLKGNLTSKYFERDGSLYEWNAAGDIIVYTADEDGGFSQSQTYSSLVPRTAYRDFFFYDDDKFIGISTGNAVSMHQIVDNQLVFVKTPAGANTFGAGFGMEKFLPAKGFFFAVAADGIMKTWVAKNDATWGTPNGTEVSKTFIYKPVLVHDYKYLIGVDSDGYLWNIPFSTMGTLGNKSKIGSGWNKFVKLISVGKKLLCLDSNGDFYEFDFSSVNHYWILD